MASGWDRTVDVVVVGYGGAGAAAAMAAHDAGAEVLLLESTGQGGGNTLVSFGGFVSPGETGRGGSYISALYDYAHSDKDEELIRAFVAEAQQTIPWLQSLGERVEVLTYGGASYPEIPGAEVMKKYVVKGPHKGATAFARNLWQLLSRAVEKRGIPVLTNTPVKRLLTASYGAVTGVRAAFQGGELLIRARRGVILTTGGYGADSEMLRNHVKGSPLYSLGHPGNRGDGVRLAQQAGAKLWHMNGVSCGFGLKTPEFEPALLMAIGGAGHIFVDRTGRRFVNEAAIERHAGLLAVDYFDSHALTYPRIPFYLIFDEETRQRGPLSRLAGLGAAGVGYKWSRDNSAEIARGWIVRAETVVELARRLGMNGATLTETVQQWNVAVLTGCDKEHGRPIPVDRGSALINYGPYYAVEIYPSLINTQGGPRRNARAQIVDVFDEPIAGLYGAGELGSMWGLIYQGGGNIAEALAFGRIAGESAAAAAER